MLCGRSRGGDFPLGSLYPPSFLLFLRPFHSSCCRNTFISTLLLTLQSPPGFLCSFIKHPNPQGPLWVQQKKKKEKLCCLESWGSLPQLAAQITPTHPASGSNYRLIIPDKQAGRGERAFPPRVMPAATRAGAGDRAQHGTGLRDVFVSLQLSR